MESQNGLGLEEAPLSWDLSFESQKFRPNSKTSTPCIYRNVAISASKTWTATSVTSPAALAVLWFHTNRVKAPSPQRGEEGSVQELLQFLNPDRELWAGSALGVLIMLQSLGKEGSQSDEFVLVSDVSLCSVKHLSFSKGSHNPLMAASFHWSSAMQAEGMWNVLWLGE